MSDTPLKYKVHEFAKDIGYANNDIMDLMEKYATRPKNHMAPVTAKELDILFEVITAQRHR